MASRMGPANAVVGSGVSRGSCVSIAGGAGESVGAGVLAGTQAVKIPVNNNPATSGRILGGVVFMLILPFPCNAELPKGLELCCPAEAGCSPSILAHASGAGPQTITLPAGGAGKPHSMRVTCALQAQGHDFGRRSPPGSGLLSVDLLVGRTGLEPVTLCLKGTCSAIELTARDAILTCAV
jgi:hypothetical protein